VPPDHPEPNAPGSSELEKKAATIKKASTEDKGTDLGKPNAPPPRTPIPKPGPTK